MILGMSTGAFTLLHVIITLIAIGSGLIVVGGMFASHKLPGTTALFLFTTALTSLTGFLFPIQGFTPALGVGIVACLILAVALFALYKERLAGQWRWIYVITAIVSLYLNVFVLVAQRVACNDQPAAIVADIARQRRLHVGRQRRCRHVDQDHGLVGEISFGIGRESVRRRLLDFVLAEP